MFFRCHFQFSVAHQIAASVLKVMVPANITVFETHLQQFKAALRKNASADIVGNHYHTCLEILFKSEPYNKPQINLIVAYLPEILEKYGEGNLTHFLLPHVQPLKSLIKSLLVDQVKMNYHNSAKGSAIWVSFYFSEARDYERDIVFSCMRELYRLKAFSILDIFLSNYYLDIELLITRFPIDPPFSKHNNFQIMTYIGLLQYIFEMRRDIFDSDILHNVLITLEMLLDGHPDFDCINQIYTFLLDLEVYSYKIDDLVICSMFESLIISLIYEYPEIQLKSYLLTFKGKDENWTENSILSLETLLFAEIYDINLLTPSDKIPWNIVIKYFQFYTNLFDLKCKVCSALSNQVMTLSSKLLNRVDIPKKYEFKQIFIKFMESYYSSQNDAFDHLTNFNLIAGYLCFNDDLKIKNSAISCLLKMIHYQEDFFLGIFQMDNIITLKDKLSFIFSSEQYKFLSLQCTLPNLFIPFDELFATIYEFDNLFDIKDKLDEVLQYSENDRKRLLESAESFDQDVSWPYSTFQKFLCCLLDPSIKNINDVRNDCLQAISTLSSTKNEKTLRMFLYSYCLLGSNPGVPNYKIPYQKAKELSDTIIGNPKTKLGIDETIVFEMLNYTAQDIDYCLNLFLELDMSDIFIDNYVKCLCRPNIHLLSITLQNSNVFNRIKNSKSRFKIFQTLFFVEDADKFMDLLLKLFDIPKTSSVENHRRKQLAWYTFIVNYYRLMNINDRMDFWNEFSDVLLNQSNRLFYRSITKFNTLLRNKDFIYINKHISFILLPKENNPKIIESKVQESLKNLKKSNNDKLRLEPKIDDGAIVKTFEDNVGGTDLIREISITVYTKGKPANIEPTVDIHKKKLTNDERKKMFLDKHSKSLVHKYSQYLLNLMTDDLFRCTFKNRTHVGMLLAKVFGSPINFNNISFDDMYSVLMKYKPVNPSIIFIKLFAKFADLLIKRNIGEEFLTKKSYELSLLL